MSDGPVLAATAWPSNAALIADCARLGYLRPDDTVLDPTYGKGNWWVEWRPTVLITHNRDEDGSDFRGLPYEDGFFDAIAYDPPYVCVGGRTTSGIPGMHAAYGLTDAPRSPAELQLLINAGLTEMHRLVRPSARKAMDPDQPNGVVLVKCQNYVSSGELWLGVHHTIAHALSLGFRVWDWMEHVFGPRPQPGNRTRADGKPVVQQHARRNLSTLLVLRKPR